MAKKTNPNRVFKVFRPDTGLYINKRWPAAKVDAWDEDGIYFATANRARQCIEYYLVMTAEGKKKPPLVEIVEFEFKEVKRESIQYPVFTGLRRFLRKSHSYLWSGLGRFASRAVQEGRRFKYLVWLDGNQNPHQQMNLDGRRRAVHTARGSQTYLTAEDETTLMAIKLSNQDDIVQIWDFGTGRLVEGVRDRH